MRSIVALCAALDIAVLAECVETVEEYRTLRQCGIHLMQGYLFAKPGYECLPEVNWPDGDGAAKVKQLEMRAPETKLPYAPTAA